jgi:hypothetical protein
VECLAVRNNSFKLIVKNKDNQEIDLDYQLHDSIVSQKWFKKIKHLKNITVDDVESYQCDVSDLKTIYREFCIFANIDPIEFEIADQSLLNDFHKLYEKTHEHLSRKKNNSILYKFHHSIHYNENKEDFKNTSLTIGWGTKEGPLTENFNCNQYYEEEIKRNNIYLPWAELAKTPLTYWENKEPDNQDRINELCKPHVTMRAKFFISYEDITPKKFGVEFIKWFDQYKNNWLIYHNIKKWDEVDEYSAPLLATAYHNEDISNLKFQRIVT